MNEKHNKMNICILTCFNINISFFSLLMNDFKLSSKSYFNNWLLTSRWLAPVTSLFDSPLKTLFFQIITQGRRSKRGWKNEREGWIWTPTVFCSYLDVLLVETAFLLCPNLFNEKTHLYKNTDNCRPNKFCIGNLCWK